MGNCLTEGFNLPALDIAIMLRPTRNAALYLQAIGRVLRKDPNNPAKTHGYIIDIIDTAKRRGGEECPLPTDDDVPDVQRPARAERLPDGGVPRLVL